MPKDTTQDDAGPIESAKNVLTRGAACLYCRKRRIRCSAAKPTCDNCKKLQRECVYDTGKPVSRVKQLEEKVAELEQMLGAGSRKGSGDGVASGSGAGWQPEGYAGGSGTGFLQGTGNNYPNGYATARTSTNGHQSSAPTSSSNNSTPPFSFGMGDLGSTQYSIPTQTSQPMEFNLGPDPPSFNPFLGFGAAFASGSTAAQPSLNQSSVFPQFNALDVPIEDTFDFSMLDPNFMNLVNSFSDTLSPTQLGVPQASSISPDARSASSQPRFERMGQSDQELFELFTAPQADMFQSPPSNGGPGPFGGPSGSSTYPINTPVSTAPSTNSHPSLGRPFTPYSAPSISDKAVDQFSGSINPQTNAIGLSAAYDISCVQGEIPEPRKGTRTFGLAMASRDNGDSERTDPSLEGLPLVGGWFDAADLPTVARDHLLDIFFSGMKIVGQEFHIPRFLASLSLPPLRRPHPCLLYTMYLLASRASTHQPIRALESHFYSIALRQLEEAVARADRLLDATRAATMLAVYKYGLAKYHEGYMMTGMAARLAVSSGLHQIPSCVFKPSRYTYDRRADLGALMRQRAYILGPPADAIDLGERIWAFWAVYTVDRCGAIAAQWPCAIPDDIISTPFPKPLHEFELGLVSELDNITITHTWTPSFPFPSTSEPTYNPRAKSSVMTLYIRGLSILERASKLMYLTPEPGWEAALEGTGASNGPSPGMTIDDFLRTQDAMGGGMGPGGGQGQRQMGEGDGRGWTKTARIRVPRAYEQVRQALMRVESDLPEERRTEWATWDGRIAPWHVAPGRKKEAVTLHFVLGCAWMFLFDVYSFTSENTLAVNVARRLTGTIKHVIQEDEYAEMDVFISMVFSFIVKILIREVKRLHSIGDHLGAKPLEGEIEIVVQALKKVGQKYNVASMQAMRADRYRKSTEQETDFLKTDDL